MRARLFETPAARATLLYVAVAATWVILADLVFVRLTENAAILTWLDASKGWVLVAVTAIVLYTERRRADRNADRLAAVVAATDDAIVGATTDGVVTDWNAGAGRLYECSPREAIGRPLAELVMPDRPDQIADMLELVRAGMSCGHRESVRMRRDGREACLSLSMFPIRNARGDVVGVSATARDVTERKRAEDEQRLAEIGKLASGLVHEIRNPLNAMRMQIAVIRGKLQRPEETNLALAAGQLSRLEQEVLRVTDLATGFLAYGRPGPDRTEDLDVADVLRDVMEFVRPAFEERGLALSYGGPEAGGELRVRMDRGKLRQVILNLAENARQAMEGGGELRLSAARVSEREVLVTVEDDGPGIPSDRVGRVFEPFYSGREGGTGLGLAIVKRTVESAGGRVALASEPGRGARFEIRLPAGDGTP